MAPRRLSRKRNSPEQKHALLVRVLRQKRHQKRKTHERAVATNWNSLEVHFRAAGLSLDAVTVRSGGEGCGLGAFARRDLCAGEVVFRVPQTAMLTEAAAVEDECVAAAATLLRAFGEEGISELLVCLRLCRARVQTKDRFHAYATSLPRNAPGVGSWPEIYDVLLANSSLGPLIRAADAELDRWEGLIDRVADATFLPYRREVFCRSNLQWARGMVQSRHFPGTFGGSEDERSPCMVPLLDILNHQGDAEVNVQIHGGCLEFRCDTPVQAGEQIWNNYGAKGNTELMMCYGFAVEGNEEDSVELSLAQASGEAPSELRLSIWGLPEELANETTRWKRELLEALEKRKSAAKGCLASLPITTYASSASKFRIESIEAFLKGQLEVLEICCDELQ
ncbi:unnamed protein product [Polarella glacialis]|uniref:SET domain-containing protein n=1 Tax=Polarella glacialis TaxID=89957 RepID=A0A813FQY3_POLGL|nr:unnamed protein product [Polarella glacialis]CAE8715601.1 unnamed protein product [Polarella glacialis]